MTSANSRIFYVLRTVQASPQIRLPRSEPEPPGKATTRAIRLGQASLGCRSGLRHEGSSRFHGKSSLGLYGNTGGRASHRSSRQIAFLHVKEHMGAAGRA